MSTTVSHPISSAQAQAIADLTGYEDAATVGKRKARYLTVRFLTLPV
jgi:hypothetical protein